MKFTVSIPEATATVSKIIDKINQVTDGNNTLEEIADVDQELSHISGVVEVLKLTHPDENARKAFSDMHLQLTKANQGVLLKPTYYTALESFENKYDGELEVLRKRYIEMCEREGAGSAFYDQLLYVSNRLSELSSKFEENLNKKDSKFEFSEEELAGCPKDFIKKLKKAGKKRVVTLEYPDYYPVMENCSVDKTRLTLSTAFNNRCLAENLPLLYEAIRLRDEKTGILNFNTYPEYVHKSQMSGHPSNVENMYKEICDRVREKAEAELQLLADMKGDAIYLHDVSYWQEQYIRKHLKVNSEEMRKYFPFQNVVNGTMKAYQKLLNLEIKEEPMIDAWVSSLSQFSVSVDGVRRGIFYLDLFPRKGKYGHACCAGVPRYKENESTAVMVCNFEKERGLNFGEVETFFHEFGHVIHFILGDHHYATINSFGIETDFIEAPSQMQELFLYEQDVIEMLIPAGMKPPMDKIAAIRKAAQFFSGITLSRQIVFGKLDIDIHTIQLDLNKVYENYLEKYSSLRSVNPVNMLSNFGHIMGGYAASYYGYMWADIIAVDMFYQFKKNKQEVGIRYRKEVLEQGALYKASELVEAFLGRPANSRAFLEWNGC
jgi:thimet oligopeptidase